MRQWINRAVYKLGYLLEKPFVSCATRSSKVVRHPLYTMRAWTRRAVTMRQVRPISRKGSTPQQRLRRREGMFTPCLRVRSTTVVHATPRWASSPGHDHVILLPAQPLPSSTTRAAMHLASSMSVENPQRPYAGHRAWRRGEEMVRPAWRHAEPGRNDLAPNGAMRSARRNTRVGPYPLWAKET